jgi:amino acid permease
MNIITSIILMILGFVGLYVVYLTVDSMNMLYIGLFIILWILLGWYLTKREEKQESKN